MSPWLDPCRCSACYDSRLWGFVGHGGSSPAGNGRLKIHPRPQILPKFRKQGPLPKYNPGPASFYRASPLTEPLANIKYLSGMVTRICRSCYEVAYRSKLGCRMVSTSLTLAKKAEQRQITNTMCLNLMIIPCCPGLFPGKGLVQLLVVSGPATALLRPDFDINRQECSPLHSLLT